MPGRLVTMRSLASASKAPSSINSRSPAIVKTERTGEESLRTTSVSRLRVVSKKNMAAVFRSSPLQTCAPAARPTDVAEVGPEKGNANRFKSRLELDTMDSHYSSSGSEHEPSSVCLAAMVHEFMEHEGENRKCGRSRCNCEAGACSCAGNPSNDTEDGKSSLGRELPGILQGLTECTDDSERILFSEVTKALNAEEEEARDSSPRRAVMKHLRSVGYNAAICKSRWDHAGGFPGGDYEYIDVVSVDATTSKSERVLIDIYFRAQFEIARPTKDYNAIVQGLPIIFVGGEDRLQQIVSLMSDAVKASLKKRGMPLPPWRKPEYMRAKWLSSYKRSSNQSSHSRGKEPRTPDISRIAIRDSGWDSKYTNEMEVEYQKVEVRQAMKEIQKGEDDVYPTNLNAVPQVSNNPLRHCTTIEPAIENMEWELPAVEAKVSRRPALTGLAAILKEAGLTASNTQPKEEQQIIPRRSVAMAM